MTRSIVRVNGRTCVFHRRELIGTHVQILLQRQYVPPDTPPPVGLGTATVPGTQLQVQTAPAGSGDPHGSV
jgi:hypothetical protein